MLISNFWHVFAAVLPALVILFYVYKQDQFPEPKNIVFKTFIFGCYIVIFLNLILTDVDNFAKNYFSLDYLVKFHISHLTLKWH